MWPRRSSRGCGHRTRPSPILPRSLGHSPQCPASTPFSGRQRPLLWPELFLLPGVWAKCQELFAMTARPEPPSSRTSWPGMRLGSFPCYSDSSRSCRSRDACPAGTQSRGPPQPIRDSQAPTHWNRGRQALSTGNHWPRRRFPVAIAATEPS